MFRPRGARERFAVGLWLVIALFIGNGIYDVLITRGIKEFLFRHALAESGQASPESMRALMQVTVRHATLVGLLWGGVIFFAGLLTIALVRAPRRD